MKTCPFCAEQIQDAAIKCRYCGTSLTDQPLSGPPNYFAAYDGLSRPADEAPRRSRLTLAEQELVYQTTKKKSMTGAVLLNILWAGAGNLYVGAEGGWFVLFTFFSWAFTALWVGFGVVTFGLFLWSTVKCSKEIERQHAELRSRISRGEFDSGVK